MEESASTQEKERAWGAQGQAVTETESGPSENTTFLNGNWDFSPTRSVGLS